MGLLLKQTIQHQGGRPREKNGGDAYTVSDESQRLSDLGIEKHTSSRMQALAEVPEEDRERKTIATVPSFLTSHHVWKQREKTAGSAEAQLRAGGEGNYVLSDDRSI